MSSSVLLVDQLWAVPLQWGEGAVVYRAVAEDPLDALEGPFRSAFVQGDYLAVLKSSFVFFPRASHHEYVLGL